LKATYRQEYLFYSFLESTGFDVVRDYGDRTKAVSIIYSSDPQDLKWNIYTEGRSATAFNKYDPEEIAVEYAPWDSDMPGAQNPSFWNYKNATRQYYTKTYTWQLYFGNGPQRSSKKRCQKWNRRIC
jgi:peptide/nickel transport system substrate-binding protein